MFSRGVRSDIFRIYRIKKSILAKMLRWQFGAEQKTPYNAVKFPGPKHTRAAEQAEAIESQKVKQAKQ